MWYFYAWIFLRFCLIHANTVAIDQGRLTGIRLQSRNGTPYWAFFGIPYAKPPVGPWRFQVIENLFQ